MKELDPALLLSPELFSMTSIKFFNYGQNSFKSFRWVI